MNTSARRQRPQRRALAAVRRQRLLAKLHKSGLSAWAFARKHRLAYTTLWCWRRKQSSAPPSISFREIELPSPSAQPLVLELGPGVRLRLSSPGQIELAAQLLKHLQA